MNDKKIIKFVPISDFNNTHFKTNKYEHSNYAKYIGIGTIQTLTRQTRKYM